jgi:hypothetical protein
MCASPNPRRVSAVSVVIAVVNLLQPLPAQTPQRPNAQRLILLTPQRLDAKSLRLM